MKRHAIGITALVMVVGLAAPATPAHAQQCSARLILFVTTFTCAVAANPDHGFIHVDATPFTTVGVQDLGTQVFIVSQTVGAFGLSRTITGLSGIYGGSGRTLTNLLPIGTLTLSNE